MGALKRHRQRSSSLARMSEHIEIRLDPGLPDTDFLAKISVSPEAITELRQALEAEGFQVDDWFQKDLGSTLAAVLISAGGLTGLAKAMQAFFHRHDGKKVVLDFGANTFEVQGYSFDDTLKLVKALEELRQANQKAEDEFNAKWRR